MKLEPAFLSAVFPPLEDGQETLGFRSKKAHGCGQDSGALADRLPVIGRDIEDQGPA